MAGADVTPSATLTHPCSLTGRKVFAEHVITSACPYPKACESHSTSANPPSAMLRDTGKKNRALEG